MSWTPREATHACDGIFTYDTYSSDLSSFAGATIQAQTGLQDLLGMMFVLQGRNPVFYQSTSFATTTCTGTFTSTFQITLTKASLADNCLILMLGTVTFFGGPFKDFQATFSLTDTNGNVWAPGPPGGASNFAAGSGDARMLFYCTVANGPDVSGKTPTTITVTTTTTTPNNLQDYSVAVHEYYGITALVIPPFRWTALTCEPTASLPIYLPFSGVLQGIHSVSDPLHICSPGQGQTGSSEPGPNSWPSTVGGVLTGDGFVAWQCIGAPAGALAQNIYTGGDALHSSAMVTLSFSSLSPTGSGVVVLFSWIHEYVPLFAPGGGGTPLPVVSISCGTPPIASAGVPYSFALPVTGGVPPLAFAITAGSLPPGLTLNAITGVISGNPTTAGNTYSYTIQVTDSGGNTASTGVCSASPPPPHSIIVSRCPVLDLVTSYVTTPSVGDIVYADCYSTTPSVPDFAYIDSPGYPHFTAFHRARLPQDERHLYSVLQRAWDAAETVLKIRS